MAERYAHTLDDVGGDYVRSALGSAICLAPVFYSNSLTGGSWLLLGVSALFLLFLAKTIIRHMTTITVDADGIVLNSLLRRELKWRDMTGLRVSYFSTWRNRGKGWMQLKLQGRGVTIRIASSLDGYQNIVRTAAAAAGRNGLQLDQATADNIARFEDTNAGIGVRA